MTNRICTTKLTPTTPVSMHQETSSKGFSYLLSSSLPSPPCSARSPLTLSSNHSVEIVFRRVRSPCVMTFECSFLFSSVIHKRPRELLSLTGDTTTLSRVFLGRYKMSDIVGQWSALMRRRPVTTTRRSVKLPFLLGSGDISIDWLFVAVIHPRTTCWYQCRHQNQIALGTKMVA